MSMGEQIKAMRQIRGLTQGELAVKVEMATITIQQYERGVRTPKIEALQKIAQALEMPIGTFLPSMGMTENFGFRVRETRKKQHLSMEQLGQKMGISGSLVGRYERNEEHPKPDTIRRFSDALGVDAKWLEKGEYDDNSLSGNEQQLLRYILLSRPWVTPFPVRRGSRCPCPAVHPAAFSAQPPAFPFQPDTFSAFPAGNA